jgi:hypothetical protein
MRIEIDHADLVLQVGFLPFELREQRAGGLMEAQQHDRGAVRERSLVAVLVVEIAEAHALEPGHRPRRDGIAADDHERAQHRQQRKGKRDDGRALHRQVIRRHPELDQDERELAELGKVDGGQQARAQAMPHQVERYEGGDETADDRERGQRQREADHRERRHRYHHSERDEEQRDEEVAQPVTFAVTSSA